MLNVLGHGGDLSFFPHLCVGFFFLILYPAPGPDRRAHSVTHNFVIYHLSHTNFVTHSLSAHHLSHTICHTQLYHTPSLQLCHASPLCHTPLFHTHNFVTHQLSPLCHTLCFTHHLSHTLSHTSLSHTIFHTPLCHTLSFTHHLCHIRSFTHTTLSHSIFHHFVTHSLSHTIFHTLFHTPSLTLSHATLSHNIDLPFAWQAWHLWHWAGLWCRAWAQLVAQGAAPLCVAGVALGDIDVPFAWQAWHLVTSTFVLRGRRGTWSH